MRFAFLIVFAFWLAFGSPARCQVAPPPPWFWGGDPDSCAAQYSDFDYGVCQAQRFSGTDQALNQSYDQLYQILPPDQQVQLRHQELAWIGRRDDECEVKLNGRILIDFTCAIRMTEARKAELDEARNAPPKLSRGEVLVAGTAKPWNWDPTGLNTKYEFGDHDGNDPVVLTLSQLHARVEDTLSLKYVSGQVSIGPDFPQTDANGVPDPQFSFGGDGSSGKPFPSAFMSPYPIHPGALVGGFTDGKGQLVEPPFAIGDSSHVLVPAKATQLQLGVNDDYPSDNAGAFIVSVKVVPPQ